MTIKISQELPQFRRRGDPCPNADGVVLPLAYHIENDVELVFTPPLENAPSLTKGELYITERYVTAIVCLETRKYSKFLKQ
jgi:hypothetical protein